MIKKSKNSLFTKFYNDSYNFFFLIFNNIKINKTEDLKKINKKIDNIENSTSLLTAWLLNIKRLYNLTERYVDLKDYHFLDIGCGNGIPLIYAYKKLSFASYEGFDLVPQYVRITKENIKSSNKGIKNLYINSFVSDASKIILNKNKKFFIFMFNPFNGIIMKKFLKNNYINLKKNKSVIAYSNYNELKIIKKYAYKTKLIKKYKLAACFF
jgi:ribosomal protein L11 methylase PrmA